MSSDTGRWLALGAVLLVATGGLYGRYEATRPCARPIAYAFGTIDPRFNTATSSLVEAARLATHIWSGAVQRNLFVYDPRADLKINLLYDEREADSQAAIEISREQASLDSTRAELDARQGEFIARQAAYNTAASAANARGGATPSEHRALADKRIALDELSSGIQRGVDHYNASTADFNAKVRRFNVTAGHTFEEGKYVQSSGSRHIDIYEFVETTQLERVLAHEFGHALGLDHNDDPKSIMYAKNESGNLTPTPSDLATLQALCGLN